MPDIKIENGGLFFECEECGKVIKGYITKRFGISALDNVELCQHYILEKDASGVLLRKI